MSQAQIEELEVLLLDMVDNGDDPSDIDFILSEIDALSVKADAPVEEEEEAVSKAPTNRGESKRAKEKGAAIENITEQARVDPMGVINAVASGLNQGAFDLLDLPVDLVNLVTGSINNTLGYEYIPPQLNVSEATDLATNYLVGIPVATAATAPADDVDTMAERLIYKASQYGGGGAAGGATISRNIYNLGKTTFQKGTQSPFALANVEGAVGVAGGLGAGGALEAFPGSPVAELVGGVLGSFTPAAISKTIDTVGRTFQNLFDPFSAEGRQRRLAEGIQTASIDPEKAAANIDTNLLVAEEAGIDVANLTTDQLVNDPQLAATLRAISSDSDRVGNIIASGRQANTDVLVGKIQKEIPQAKRAVDVVNTANKYITKETNLLQEKVALITNELDVLKGQGKDLTTDEESVKFVAAIKEAYEKARGTERNLWTAIESKEPLDLQPLKQSIGKLAKKARKGGRADSMPTAIYKTRNNMGYKTTEAGNKVMLRNDFGFLSEYRSSVLRAIRKADSGLVDGPDGFLLREVEKEIAEFIDKAGTKEAYRAAANYSRTLRQNFNHGKIGALLQRSADTSPRIEPEEGLSKFITQGSKGAARGRDIEALSTGQVGEADVRMPAAPQVAKLAEETLEKKFYEAPKSFFKNYASILKTFPTLKTNLQTKADEIEAMAIDLAKAQGRISTPTDEKVAAVSKLVDADPDKLYSTLSNLKRSELAQIKTVAAQDGVEEGLQSVVLTEFLNKLRNTSKGDWSVGLDSLQYTKDTDSSFAAMYDILLTPAQKEGLVKMDKAAKIAFKDSTNGLTSKQADTLAASPAIQAFASMLALKAASFAPVGGPGQLAFANRASSMGQRFVNGLTRTQSQALVERMLLEPEILKKLLRMPLDKAQTAEEAADLMRVYLLSAGIDIQEDLPELEEPEETVRRSSGGQMGRQKRQQGMLTGM